MFLYMLEVDNHQQKSKFYGHKKIYYVGITNDIEKRYIQHLRQVGSKFLRDNFQGANRKLVYVEYMPKGVNWRAREIEVKRLSIVDKKILIISNKNILESVQILQTFYNQVVKIKLKGEMLCNQI